MADSEVGWTVDWILLLFPPWLLRETDTMAKSEINTQRTLIGENVYRQIFDAEVGLLLLYTLFCPLQK